MFGKEKPLKEVLRENKRMITRAIRELDREKVQLEREEKRLIMEIKKAAKEQQMGAVNIMAKDLVRTRQYISKFIDMRSHLQGCALKLQTVKSHQAMAEAMSNTAKAMTKMNKAVDVKSISKMLQQFEKENAKSDMMQEVMGDALDDAMYEEGNADEEEQIVQQVLDEIGINFDGEIPTVPSKMANTNAAAGVQNAGVMEPAGGDPAVDELEERLNNLKR